MRSILGKLPNTLESMLAAAGDWVVGVAEEVESQPCPKAVMRLSGGLPLESMDVAEFGGLPPMLEARAWECVSMPVHEEVEDVAEVDTALGGKGNESVEGFRLVDGDMTGRERGVGCGVGGNDSAEEELHLGSVELSYEERRRDWRKDWKNRGNVGGREGAVLTTRRAVLV